MRVVRRYVPPPAALVSILWAHEREWPEAGEVACWRRHSARYAELEDLASRDAPTHTVAADGRSRAEPVMFWAAQWFGHGVHVLIRELSRGTADQAHTESCLGYGASAPTAGPLNHANANAAADDDEAGDVAGDERVYDDAAGW